MDGVSGIAPLIMTMALFAIPISLCFMFLIRKARQRHEEAMALIEKGQYDPALLAEPERKYRKEKVLLVGILFLAIGIALFIGMLIIGAMDTAASEDPAGFIMGGLICCCIGVGLIIFYVILRRIEKQRLEREET